MGQETRNLETDLNETLSQAATCKQALKHLEPDVQAIQGRKDLEVKIAEYTQCKYFRVQFNDILMSETLIIRYINRIMKKKQLIMKMRPKHLMLLKKK